MTAEYYLDLGNKLWDEDKYAEALSAYNEAIKLAPDWDVPYLYIGSCYFTISEFEQAILSFKKAIFINSQSEAAYSGVGMCLIFQKKYGEAIAWYEKAKDINPRSDTAYHMIGECLKSQGFYNRAIEYYHHALKLKPSKADAYVGIGDCLEGQEEYDKSMQWYSNAIKLNPNWEKPYSCIGSCLRLTGKYEQAKQYYKQAIKLKPDWSEPYWGVGDCLWRQKEYDEAVQWHKRAIKLNPDWEIPYHGIGDCRRAQQQYKEAEQWYKQAIKLKPDWEGPYLSIGECLRKQKQHKEAKLSYEQALQLKPNWGMAYLSLYLIPDEFFSAKEVSGMPFLCKGMLTLKKIDLIRYASFITEELIKHEGSLLLDSLFNDLNLSAQNDLFANPGLLESLRVIQHFKQQFYLWQQDTNRTRDAYLAEAIMSYYLGNPIRAFELFDNFIEESPKNPLYMQGHYYFALSAAAILNEEKDSIINYALPLAEKCLHDNTANDTEQYYAALIVAIAGKTEEALTHLETLANKNMYPAIYQLARIRSRTETPNEIQGMQVTHDPELLPMPFLFPGPILLSGNATDMLHQLTPMLLFMENKNTIADILANSKHNHLEIDSIFRTQYLFAKNVQFEHLVNEDDRYKYVQNNHPAVFEKIYGNNEELSKIALKTELYNKYSTEQQILDELSKEIHSGAFTDYTYRKQNLRNAPQKLNYGYYIKLISHLMKQKLLTEMNAVLLHEYTKYCALIVYTNSETSIQDTLADMALGEIKDSLIGAQALFLGIGYGHIEKSASVLFEKLYGKRSDVIDFRTFCKEMNTDENTV